MSRDLDERIALAWHESGGSGLCLICREVLSASGAGITLIAGDNRSQLCASDPRTARLEDLQFTSGEGPSVDGCRSDRPVSVGDLGSAEAERRWPAFSGPASAAGVNAVVAFALRVGAARIGVLTVYYERPTTDDGASHSDGLAVAGLVTQSILAMQAGAPPNELAAGLASAAADRAEVHQASGMVAVQLGISIVEALVRLRSYSYALDRPVGDVSADVVARRIRIDK